MANDGEAGNVYETSDGIRMDRETNDKMVVDATLERLSEGHDKTLRQAETAHKTLAEQQSELFSTMLSERNQLFALTMGVLARATHNGITGDCQTAITNPMESADAAIAAHNVESADTEIAKVIKASLVNMSEQVRASSAVNLDAISGAVAGAVVTALKQQGIVTS